MSVCESKSFQAWDGSSLEVQELPAADESLTRTLNVRAVAPLQAIYSSLRPGIAYPLMNPFPIDDPTRHT